ncbi:unnamed protein product [Didymodactylos carnosus]|uniref:Uncharacterized protein n=1 Tax=Didymodactylos carnosus TaxID=1234261 RepID=A0A815CZZ1_9BILA|nr:unnamed protein product [Didymodactylos carnosus]CAF1634557.1 unnamed protein product [Didymodactylos carnosus]CAF4094480.1 unnamed protein product [Didymodactylos carnosus]CAF4464304.1 unnamed protein product [Didymodactylos carnosus]
MSHADALTEVQSVGINLYSTGRCFDRQNPVCTSLEQIRCTVIQCIKQFKQQSKCPLIITGGTEVGNASGIYAHDNGHKLNVRLTKCIYKYITKNLEENGVRANDGAEEFKDKHGNLYIKAYNRWDMIFTKKCDS